MDHVTLAKLLDERGIKKAWTALVIAQLRKTVEIAKIGDRRISLPEKLALNEAWESYEKLATCIWQ